MLALLLAQQTEYGKMWGLVALLVLLGVLSVAVPRFRRVDLATDEEKKKSAARPSSPKNPGRK